MIVSEENMRCPNCHLEQDQKHFYCSNCGHNLHQSKNVLPPPDINFEEHVEEATKAIKKQAHTTELETLEKIQDHATKWAKINLFFLGLASSLLVLSLSFFGYKKITDFELDAEEKSQTVKDLVKQAEKKINATIMQAEDSLNRTRELEKKVKDFDIQSIQEKVERVDMLKSQVDRKIGMAEKILKQVTAERQNVQKVQHSFFSISMQFDGSKEQLRKYRNLLIQAMDKKGFQLSRANILEIGVNQTEVLYYNEIAEKQAKLIARIVKDSLVLPGMESRLISMFDRNPHEILIKIKFP